ncbi:hypothetical protein IFU37_010940 [Pantoea agglomerans]|uniref:hypothetical protein n=2 Tax=Enterobacter agglomerans TaxID=549 RepID=UPI001783BDE6|nr:hypothetical protein [Pantoea agglomerans]WVL88173.1 hypothetical protein IFU37_010940 [Pantoea agglomerans]
MQKLEKITPTGVIMSIDKLKLNKSESGAQRAFKRNASPPGIRDLSILPGVLNSDRLEKVKRSVYF